MNKIKFTSIKGVGFERLEIADLETAKELKRLGFDLPTKWYWQDKDYMSCAKGLKCVRISAGIMDHNKYDHFCSAPTLEEFNNWNKNK